MTFHAFWLDLPHISLHKILLYTTERCCRSHACCILIILLFPPSGCPRVWEITDPSDSMQDSCSLSQLIFPINISLCAEEQAAVQLMIWITAACRPAIPAACWEPNSLLVLRSVTHAPAPPPPHPTPTRLLSSFNWKTHCALMTDAWHLPLSASHLSSCSPAVWLPLLSDFFNTPLCLLAHPLLKHALAAHLP